MLRHLADWVKTCHCRRRSWVSQIHCNCQVTHRADTQDVRDTGLMIHIPQQSGRTAAWMRGHMCTKLPGKKTLPLSLLSSSFAAVEGYVARSVTAPANFIWIQLYAWRRWERLWAHLARVHYNQWAVSLGILVQDRFVRPTAATLWAHSQRKSLEVQNM